MTKVLIKILVVISALALPLSSFGAEAAKLRYAATIYFDSKGGGLRLPEGVACGEGPFFVVADTGNGRLLRYTFQDGVPKGGDEFKIEQMSYPVRLQLSSKGEIFALDGKQRRISGIGIGCLEQIIDQHLGVGDDGTRCGVGRV